MFVIACYSTMVPLNPLQILASWCAVCTQKPGKPNKCTRWFFFCTMLLTVVLIPGAAVSLSVIFGYQYNSIPMILAPTGLLLFIIQLIASSYVLAWAKEAELAVSDLGEVQLGKVAPNENFTLMHYETLKKEAETLREENKTLRSH